MGYVDATLGGAACDPACPADQGNDVLITEPGRVDRIDLVLARVGARPGRQDLLPALHVESRYTFLVGGAKTNLTLSLDKDLVIEAKVLAARQGTSVSRLLADQLEDLVRSDLAYEAARRRAGGAARGGLRLAVEPARVS